MVPKGDNEVLVIIRDITFKIQSEKERNKIAKLESLGVLAGGIAHDFNNILTGIFGNLEILKLKISKKDPSYKFLERALSSLKRASSLTKQLLTFAKGGEPIFKAIDLKSLIKDIVMFTLTGSNVTPIFKFDKGLWPVKADEDQISQIISNLTINAKQAMPSGGNLYISAENINKEDSYVLIKIKDEGEGIPPEIIDKIFDPFFTTKKSGSGLGLSTVHSIIKKHNGEIKVESVLGKGTTFRIYLPALKKPVKSNQLKEKEKKIKPFRKKLNILIMDDEDMVREIASEMLKTLGHNVDCAHDGAEAIKKYRDSYNKGKNYDVVIMDLTVKGGMGGEEAAKEILSIDNDANIIVSSGYYNNPIMSQYKKYGFKAILTKPYKIENLREILNIFLEQN